MPPRGSENALMQRWMVLVSIGLGVAVPAQATVTGGAVTGGYSSNNGGVFVKLTVPFTESDPDNTVGDNTFQNLNLYAFDEDQNIVLPGALDVDDLANGMGAGTGAGTLAAGTVVASHYVFYDPAGNLQRSQIGTVTFDSNVLAVISSSTNLGSSDFLINNGVSYLSPTLRGLESNDDVIISGLQEVTLDWSAANPGDYVRVLTTFSALPEPAPVGLLAMAVLLAAAGRGRTLRRR